MNLIQQRRHKLLLVLVLAGLLLFTAVSPAFAAPTESNETGIAESGGVYHTVRYGEYLSLIAQYYGVSVQAILNANPHITNPNLIYAGTVLYIPPGYYPDPYYPPSGYGGYGCRYQHYVSYGENLSSIGYWYGVNPWMIASANHIYNINHIYAGQYLCIP